MKWKKECTDISNSREIVCKEHRRQIIFLNPGGKEVKKIRIDGCQITAGKRCDCLVIAANTQHFVELKGKHIKTAIEQLKRCIVMLGKSGYRKKSYIITSRSPFTSAEIQNFKLKFKRATGSDLVIRNKEITVFL